VTVQAQILDLLHTLREETGMGLLLVTHDVGVAAHWGSPWSSSPTTSPWCARSATGSR